MNFFIEISTDFSRIESLNKLNRKEIQFSFLPCHIKSEKAIFKNGS